MKEQKKAEQRALAEMKAQQLEEAERQKAKRLENVIPWAEEKRRAKQVERNRQKQLRINQQSFSRSTGNYFPHVVSDPIRSN